MKKNIYEYFSSNHFNDNLQIKKQQIKPKQKPYSNIFRRKNSQIIFLQIHFGVYIKQMSFRQQQTVAQLFQTIKNLENIHKQYAPKGYQPVGITSMDNNEMIDYFLTIGHQKLYKLRNLEKLKVIYSIPNQFNKQNIQMSDFEFLKCLGKGVSASVFLGICYQQVRHKLSCKLFALKQIKKQYICNYKQLQQLLRQKKILKQIPVNQYVIKFYGSFQSQNHLNFITQFYPGGQLFFHMQHYRLNQFQSKIYFCQILLCLQFLHKNHILYRDLKVFGINQPQNILLNYEGHLYIADFGLSKFDFKQEQMTDSYCGSPQYMAPQIISRTGYSYSVDFYTLGALLFQFVTGLPPYYTQDQQILIHNIVNKKLKIPEQLSPQLQRLLSKILQKNPNQRINSFQQLKSCKWLADIDWSKVQNKSYKPPFVPSLYQSYIHQQFLQTKVQHLNKKQKGHFQHLFQFFNYIKPQAIKYFFNIKQDRDTLLSNLSKTGCEFSARRTEGSHPSNKKFNQQKKSMFKNIPSQRNLKKKQPSYQKLLQKNFTKKNNQRIIQFTDKNELSRKKSSSNILSKGHKLNNKCIQSNDRKIGNKIPINNNLINQSQQQYITYKKTSKVKDKTIITINTPYYKDKQNLLNQLKNIKGDNICASTKSNMNMISHGSSENLLKLDSIKFVNESYRNLTKRSYQKDKDINKCFKKKNNDKSFINIKLKPQKSMSKIKFV